ncbi:hypothetical protein DFJ73DRAFT_833607 [Zopfochytrium polystomum]|nr:hypothetical protein DFJ73DRAFT_833607 [Zopfochytrium polystomum]
MEERSRNADRSRLEEINPAANNPSQILRSVDSFFLDSDHDERESALVHAKSYDLADLVDKTAFIGLWSNPVLRGYFLMFLLQHKSQDLMFLSLDLERIRDLFTKFQIVEAHSEVSKIFGKFKELGSKYEWTDHCDAAGDSLQPPESRFALMVAASLRKLQSLYFKCGDNAGGFLCSAHWQSLRSDVGMIISFLGNERPSKILGINKITNADILKRFSERLSEVARTSWLPEDDRAWQYAKNIMGDIDLALVNVDCSLKRQHSSSRRQGSVRRARSTDVLPDSEKLNVHAGEARRTNTSSSKTATPHAESLHLFTRLKTNITTFCEYCFRQLDGSEVPYRCEGCLFIAHKACRSSVKLSCVAKRVFLDRRGEDAEVIGVKERLDEKLLEISREIEVEARIQDGLLKLANARESLDTNRKKVASSSPSRDVSAYHEVSAKKLHDLQAELRRCERMLDEINAELQTQASAAVPNYKDTSMCIAITKDEPSKEPNAGRPDLTEVVREILETESAYTGYIRDVANLREEISGLEDISEQDIKNVFANVDQLAVLHQNLSCDLQSHLEGTVKVENLVRAFQTHAKEFHLYNEYCSNQSNSRVCLQSLRQRKEIDNLILKFEKNSKLQKLGLADLLMKPMHRITRYPILFKRLLGMLPQDDTFHGEIAGLLRFLELQVYTVNECVRVQESRIRINAIEEMLEFPPSIHRFHIANGRRKLISEKLFLLRKGAANPIEVEALLFSDLLVLGKTKRDGMILIKFVLPLESVLTVDAGPQSVLLHFQSDSILLQASSNYEKSQWIEQFEQTRQHHHAILIQAQLNCGKKESLSASPTESFACVSNQEDGKCELVGRTDTSNETLTTEIADAPTDKSPMPSLKKERSPSRMSGLVGGWRPFKFKANERSKVENEEAS